MACLRIIDTGTGIPAEQIDQIFDIGFDTTGAQVKMELGLATEYKIIQEHGGEIKVESEVGKGTTVTLNLPLKDRE